MVFKSKKGDQPQLTAKGICSQEGKIHLLDDELFCEEGTFLILISYGKAKQKSVL